MHKGQPLTPMKAGGPVKETNMNGKKIATAPMANKRPVAASGSPMKKGGRACMAMGGPAKQRKGVMTSSGAPKAATSRFKGSLI